MSEIKAAPRKAQLYLCGGAGNNIGTQFVKYVGKKSPGFTELDMVFIDTSKSNMKSIIPEGKVYLLDDLDGSGKLRASNYNALAECSKELLHRHKPADINIVVHSSSGGSGSVIGPILVSELLARGEAVIVLMIGSTSSRIETENSLKTLKSYEVISTKRDVPVVAAYRENSKEKSRSQVDVEIQTVIISLMALFSGQNQELDMSDLRNFLNYTKVTSYSPKLSGLEIFSRDIRLEKGQALVSLATLVDGDTSGDVDVHPEYQAVGYLSEVARDSMHESGVNLPLHTCVISGYYTDVVNRLQKRLNGFDEVRSLHIEKAIVDRNVASTDAGLIL